MTVQLSLRVCYRDVTPLLLYFHSVKCGLNKYTVRGFWATMFFFKENNGIQEFWKLPLENDVFGKREGR